MTLLLIQGVRVLDPVNSTDLQEADVLIDSGVLRAVGRDLDVPGGAVQVRAPGSFVAPSFTDLHAHLREPGQPWKERISRATAAAAAGGFGTLCGMANLVPAVDSVDRLRECLRENRAFGKIPVLQFAACSLGLAGQQPAPLEELAAAGAAGFSDDGRNALRPDLLVELLERASQLGLVVAVHPEDEEVLARANVGAAPSPSDWLDRPEEAEVAAVDSALACLRSVPEARLHLQHLSTAASVAMVRRAKAEGLGVTAEVTPHHLSLSSQPSAWGPAQMRCNPPLRQEADRVALWEGLLDGTVDAIATDHAPHEAVSSPAERKAGFSGLQLALAAVLGCEGAAERLPRLVEALTLGPLRVMGQAAKGQSGLTIGDPSSLTWYDPTHHWVPGPENWLSLGSNTPFWGDRMQGAALLTLTGGRTAHVHQRIARELPG